MSGPAEDYPEGNVEEHAEEEGGEQAEGDGDGEGGEAEAHMADAEGGGGEEGGQGEGDGEGDEDEPAARVDKKKRKKRRAEKYIDKEADLSGSDSSDESEDERNDEYELDDFTVATVAEEGSGSSSRKKKKRRKRREGDDDVELDDDDIDLVRENTGQSIARKKQDAGGGASKKKFNRLKQRGKEDLYSTLQNKLFGGDGPDADDDAGEALLDEPRSEDELDDDDEDGGWIVDENGNPLKRRQRRARGYGDSEALRDAEDIFGSAGVDFFKKKASRRSSREKGGDEFDSDEDYGDEPRDYDSDPEEGQEAGQRKKKDPLATIYEHYEPSELEQKHFTTEDEKIRQLDVPERLQMRKSMPYDEKLVQEEADWIFKRAFATAAHVDRVLYLPRIVHVLRFMQEQLFEVPFIATYRKDYYQPLKISELWDIYDWDEKWAHLQTRKNTILQMCKALESLPTYHEGLRDYVDLVRESQSEEDLGDLQDYLQMFYGEELQSIAPETGKQKRAMKRDLYTLAKRYNLGEYAKKFSITPKEFGANMIDNYAINTPIDHDEDPDMLADSFKCGPFPDGDAVIKAARIMCAQEIAHDISVRQSVRAVYMKRAIISTVPTDKGRKEIDAFHPYMIIKRMEKPVPEIDESQMLLVLKAEKEKFVTVTIHTEEKDVLQEMEPLYVSDGTSATAEAWNNHRREILGLTLRKFLFPLFAKELRSKLSQEAENFVAYDYARRLEQQLLIAPWRPDDSAGDEDEEEEKPRLRIIATCRGGEGEPTMVAVLDEDGQVQDILKLSFLNERRTNADGRDSNTDLANLSKFIQDHQPRAIIIAAQDLESRRYFENISGIVTNLRGRRDLRKNCKVMYGDADLARAFKQSHRGISEFPEYPPLLRQAISLGRRLLDPVTEFANSCDDQHGHLVLRLHDLQDMVAPDLLTKSVTRVFINIVNAVGVDINRMLTHKHAAASLRFVSGLGVRKAEYLLHAIFRKGRSLASRDELTSFVDKCVFANCAGFIRVCAKHFMNENIDLDPLDDTRIHPEDYRLARKMAADALDREGEDAVLQECIYSIMDKPKKLDDIDLDAFAGMLESSGQIKKATLYDIKKELTHPFADIRLKYTEPSNLDIFKWLTGETDTSLQQGMVVAARAFRQTERSVLCRLENGLIGFINSENISDDRDAASSSTIPVGLTVHARVLAIDKEKFSLRLSCRGSDLDTDKYDFDKYEALKKENPFLIIELPNKDEPKKDKEQTRRSTWNVHHPLFQDIDYKGAETFLADKPIGEVVIRPSSKAPDRLTFSWKFYDSVFIHTDVHVRDKANARSLGSLYIGDNKYDDLDEIVARYMDPIIVFVNEMLSYRKFKRSSQQEVDQLVTLEKGASPQQIPYYLTAPKEHPGRFGITYMPSTRLKHEFITVSPEGFSFRRQIFKDVEHLIKWFKAHYRDPILPRGLDNKPKVDEKASAALVPQAGQNQAQAGNQWNSQGNFAMQDMQQNLPAPVPQIGLWNGWGDQGVGSGWENNANFNAPNNAPNNFPNNFNGPNDVQMGWNAPNNFNQNTNNFDNFNNTNTNTNNNFNNNRGDDRGRRDNNNFNNNRDNNYNNNRNNNYNRDNRDNNRDNRNNYNNNSGGGYGGGRDNNSNYNNRNNNYNSGGGGGGGGGRNYDRNSGGGGRDNNYNNNRRDDRDGFNNNRQGGGGGGYGGNRRDNNSNYNNNRDNNNNRRDGRGGGWDDNNRDQRGGGGGGWGNKQQQQQPQQNQQYNNTSNNQPSNDGWD